MQKSNIKSFVCSFVFSVLAVFAAQKVFFRAPEIKKNDTPANIKVENISLFSEDINEGDVVASAEPFTVPVVDTSEIDTLLVSKAEPVEEKQPVLAEQPAVIESIPQMPEVALSEPVLKQDISTDLAYASEITLDPEEIEEIKENKKHIQSGIVYADISDTLNEIPGSETEEVFEVADSQLNVADEDIPLFENNAVLHEKINVSNNADASKIAMLDPNTLINSIEEPNIEVDEKSLAEADLKKSELGAMFELSSVQTPEIDETAWAKAEAANEEGEIESGLENSAQIEDDPWVMAKGNKYAKNQAVVEEFNKKQEEMSQKSEISDEPVVQSEAEPEADSESSVEAEVDEPEETEQNDAFSLLQTDDDQQSLAQTFSEPLLKEKKTDTKLAYQMIQNILIPIPQDILNDADLTPDLTSSPEERDLSSNIRTNDNKPDLSGEEKQTGLFKSISSWFSKDKNGKEILKDQDSSTSVGSSIKQKVYSALGKVEDYQSVAAGSIMPAELRLSFQPNRAEISGQTLRWIYAFADNARDNNDVYIEVRIDGTSSYVLQQKRLNLLSSIFASRGVDWRKINTIFTSREPNSFIIRNIRFNNEEKEDQNLR